MHIVISSLRCLAGLCLAALLCLTAESIAAERAVFVVVPDQPVESVSYAADELATYLPKSTGYRVTRVAKAAWAANQRPAIVLGIAPSATASKPLPRDAYVLQTVSNDVLHIWGTDAAGSVDGIAPKGTLYGVYDYLKKDCGVRWIFPGPSGEVLPSIQQPLKIDGVQRSSAPHFEQRLITTGGWIDRPDDLRHLMQRDDDYDQRMLRWHRVWMLRNRLSTRKLVDANHAFTQWWEQYGTEHPDWFAQHRNGKRGLITKTHTVKLCTTNPEVVRATVKQGLDRVADNPWLKSISASPNDSALTAFCMCPNCRKVDELAAGGEELELRDRQGSYQYPALTDRHVVFWNQVAMELTKTRPDLLVGGYAYGAHHSPPVKAKPLPNVMIGFVQHAGVYWDIDAFQEERDCFKQWSKVCKTFLWRPNSLQMGHGIPANYLWRLSNDLKIANQRGARFASYDQLVPHWGTTGHTYYFLAELLWDVNRPIPEIWADYLQASYGPAKDVMRVYYAEMEAITEEIFQSRTVDALNWRQGGEAAAAKYYPGPHWTRMKTLLKEARQKSAKYEFGLRMIDMHEQALEFFDLQLAVNQQIYLGKRPVDFSKGPVADAIAARDKWLIKNPKSLAISTVEIADTARTMQRVAGNYVAPPRGKLAVDE